jgi:uncharacterized membrane protein
MSSKRTTVARTANGPKEVPQGILLERRDEYSGAIPPPAMLERFDELLPGTAARIIQWAEDEQQHRQQLEREAQAANVQSQQQQLEISAYQQRAVFRSDMVGQVLGFIVCVGSISGSIILGVNGHTAVAAALAVIPTAAIVQAFRVGAFSSKKQEK